MMSPARVFNYVRYGHRAVFLIAYQRLFQYPPQLGASGVTSVTVEVADARFVNIRVIITGGVHRAILVMFRRLLSIVSVVGCFVVDSVFISSLFMAQVSLNIYIKLQHLSKEVTQLRQLN